MDVTTLFLVLASLLGLGLGYNPAIECVNGIRTDLAEFTFAGGSPADYWGNLCTNNLSVHSMWAAAKVYCSEHEIVAGSKMLSDYCTEYGLVELIPYSKVLPSLTDEYIASLPVVEYSDINATKIWDHAVLLSKAFYTAGMKTTVGVDSKDIGLAG
jgi:ferric-chelate reductase